eukprot:c18156_g1_i1.p1 GENE.c18156_g1_i1~~c18156_g1_i1.p1  ORF type:complete len:188 (+),score=9.37 c18156_g1_i1:29-592(+)
MSVEQLNLEVLRRRDPEVAEIVSTAAHVAVYEYAIRDRKWDRRGVEGSLFVTRRKCAPFYRFVVMNRLGPENQTEDIVPGFEVELNHDFVLYRTHEVIESMSALLWFTVSESSARALVLRTQRASARADPPDRHHQTSSRRIIQPWPISPNSFQRGAQLGLSTRRPDGRAPHQHRPTTLSNRGTRAP